jgi:hypothetical protein
MLPLLHKQFSALAHYLHSVPLKLASLSVMTDIPIADDGILD